jgi:dTDP-4-amino-4,6-dideoxygalactose transaminase
MTPIPFVDLAAQRDEIADDVAAGLQAVFDTTAFINGEDVGAFEREFAAFCGVDHCVGVANGTDALTLALRAAGIGPGDEVIVPANTFIATAEAVVNVGATVVLVDCDPTTYLIDVAQVVARIGPKTRAVMPVHLYGQLAPVEQLSGALDADRTVIIEDAAQAQGATRLGRGAGSWGALAGTSFYPGKNLGAYGDAGAVLTSDATLARTVRLLADHGSARKYHHELSGTNSRMDTIQAVVLRAKLKRLDQWNAARRDAAERYRTLLSGIPGVVLPKTLDANAHVWHLYVVRVPQRNRVLAHLRDAGVGAGIHYPVPLHLQPAYRTLGHDRGAFPHAEAAGDHILSLPMHPHLSAAQQERTAAVLAEAVCL